MRESSVHSEACRKRVDAEWMKTGEGVRKLKGQDTRTMAAEEKKADSRAGINARERGPEGHAEASSGSRHQ